MFKFGVQINTGNPSLPQKRRGRFHARFATSQDLLASGASLILNPTKDFFKSPDFALSV